MSETADIYAEGDPFTGWNEANAANDDGGAVLAAERHAEAADAADGALPALAGCAERRQDPVYVLLYSHRHGDDVSVYASYDLAHDRLAGICREWWKDARHGDDSFPATPDGLSDDEVIARYFNAMDSTESWEITETVGRE